MPRWFSRPQSRSRTPRPPLPPVARTWAAEAAAARRADRQAEAREAVSRADHLAEAAARWARPAAVAGDMRGVEQVARADNNVGLAVEDRLNELGQLFGTMLAVGGCFDAALGALARSEELDPLSPIVPANRGWVYYFARRYPEAVAALREVLALHPDLAPAHWFLGMTRVAQGNYVGAIESYSSAIERTGRISRLLGYLGHAYGRAGHHDEAEALLQELQQRARESYVPPYFRALVLAGLDRRELALSELELAFEHRDSMLRDSFVDASFDRLRDESRFQRLIENLHLPYQGPSSVP